MLLHCGSSGGGSLRLHGTADHIDLFGIRFSGKRIQQPIGRFAEYQMTPATVGTRPIRCLGFPRFVVKAGTIWFSEFLLGFRKRGRIGCTRKMPLNSAYRVSVVR